MLYHSSEKLDRMYEQSKIGVIPVGSDVRAMIAELREHRTARWGIDSCLPRGKASDNAAVDRFARAMKEKLAAARERGRGGWDDPEQCSAEKLSRMLHDHVAKGDPVDVANFAMMIEHYGASIGIDASPASLSGGADEAVIAALRERTDVACDAECNGDLGRHDPGCVRATAILRAHPSPEAPANRQEAGEVDALADLDRVPLSLLHELQHAEAPLAKPKLGGSIIRWAVDEIAALRAALSASNAAQVSK